MKKQKLFTIIISLILILSLSACSSNDEEAVKADIDKTTVAAVTSEPAMSDSALKDTTDSAVNEEENNNASDSDEEEKTEKKESSEKDSKKKTDSTKKKEEKKKKKKKEKNSDKEKSDENSITVKSGSKTVVFTESDLKKMGVSSYTYSYRNKDSSQRQFVTVNGVKLKTIIDKSGFSGTSVRFTSKDGFTKDYSLSDLYESKKAFKKTYGTKADNVPATITIGDSDSFKLCFGQKADDDDDNGDYNAQFWVKWITTITVK